MSAILKALRRIETESVQRSESPPAPKTLDARKTIREQYRKNWTTQKLLIVLLPLLTLAVALWLVFSYKPFLIPEVSTAAEKANLLPAKPMVKSKAPVLEDKRKRTEAASPRAAPAKEEPSLSKALPKKEKMGPPDSSAAQEQGPSVQDPEFNLQAIVWSDAPESRFAVINGVIVRAGGMIEGVSVTEIGKDHVFFKSGQRSWKMRMKTE
ncbi:MAG: general secretion pathway protein GspB [Desulfobacterota bacterium]|nr:general secretion pathway protein GspB [Thermodesulfobacteriota bacterium]